jgi:dipeptidyl aminopeptidase/acylaminoacyl peptidase
VEPESPALPAPSQPVGAIPLPKLGAAEIAYVDLGAPRPENPHVALRFPDDQALLQPLVDAVNAADGKALQDGTRATKLFIWVEFRSHQRLLLSLPEGDEPVEANWQGQLIAIDAPAVRKALAALEPVLARAQKPGIQIWAVDVAGKQEPELLLERQPKPLMLQGFSPDGRYLLLTEQLGQYKGDYTAIPYLLDRSTGNVQQGAQTNVRMAQWSGHGFFIDRLAHLDLQLKETRLDSLAAALGLKEQEREIIDIAFTPDGERFAALVGRNWAEEPLDLVLGNVGGSDLTIQPRAITGMATQIGTLAWIALSPDRQMVGLSGTEGTVLVPVAKPAPENRVLLSAAQGRGLTWSPDSAHVWVDNAGLFDRSGKVLVKADGGYPVLWLPDGTGVVPRGFDQLVRTGLDGTSVPLKAPDWGVPAGFLPDGRLLVWRTVYPMMPGSSESP